MYSVLFPLVVSQIKTLASAHIQQKLAMKKPSFLLNSSIFEPDLVICSAQSPTIKVTIPEIKNE